MKNRVTVTIAGQEYTLVGTEEASYTEKVAAHVDAKVEEVLSGAHVSLVDGAILAAVNIADEYFKEVEAPAREDSVYAGIARPRRVHGGRGGGCSERRRRRLSGVRGL